MNKVTNNAEINTTTITPPHVNICQQGKNHVTLHYQHDKVENMNITSQPTHHVM